MDIKRKAYKKLLDWKTSSEHSKALMIQGARRVGKSYIAEHFGKNEYRSVMLIDFSSPVAGTLRIFEDFGNASRLDEFFNQLSVLYSVRLYPHQTLIIFDEIQKYPKARELIKHLVADNRYDYIETGSLISIKQNVKDILIPSEEDVMDLHPLDFEEFLKALGEDTAWEYIRDRYESRKPLGNILKRINELLRLYMIVGGMPQAVDSYISSRSYDSTEKVKRTIIHLYREDIAKYATGHVAEARAIFDSIPEQLSHHDKKIKYSSLKKGSRAANYTDAINWISESMVGSLCMLLEEPTEIEGFSLQPDKVKCYMADTGLLLTLAAGNNYLKSNLYKSLVLGKLSANKGMMTENLVSQMLSANDLPLRFYEKIVTDSDGKRHKYEVDFLIHNDHRTIPVEVKSGNATRHPSIDYFCKKYKRQTGKGIILTKGDLRETEDYLYLPLAMTPLI